MKKNIEFIIDAHVHCGKGYSFREYHSKIKNTNIKGAVIFCLASDIYPRGNKSFKDNKYWRKKRREANKEVLSLAKDKGIDINIYPFKFSGNDFNREDLDRYFGLKWQRRHFDPKYSIGSPRFVKIIDKIREMKMPIIFEDEPENTIRFLNEWAEGINVIIPHLGFGSQSYEKFEKENVWARKNVYTDTSFVSDSSLDIIKEHINKYGYKRIFFGSDYPFSNPEEEVDRILSLDISNRAKKYIMGKNILKQLNNVRKKSMLESSPDTLLWLKKALQDKISPFLPK